MSPGIELTKAGPVDTFHDLEIGPESKLRQTKGDFAGPKNELRRLTSLRKAITSAEFWESLPLLSKVFVITSCICALLVIAFSIQQMATKHDSELLHISLVMLVTAIFYLWFAWDAIVFENAFELVACGVLGLAVCARIIYYVASPSYKHDNADIAVAALALFLQVIVLIFGYITWGQFGWRTYSKLAADMRVSNVNQQRWSFVLVNCFTTLLKLDIQFLIILCMVGLDVGIQTTPDGEQKRPKSDPLIISNNIGLVVMLVWSGFAYRAVKHEDKNMAWLLTVLLPIMYILPVVDIVLGYSGQPTAANAKESLILSAVLVLVTRTAVWAFMHVLQKRFEYFKQQRQQLLGSHKGSATGVVAPQTPHVELAPLMRGAWIGKPSDRSPKKKRFFQLSHDGSTLRWSWNKYIVMYYVEDLEADDRQLTLTLKMALESDLCLRFYDTAQFSTWKSGFEALLQLLFSPGGLSMELSDLEEMQTSRLAAEAERRDLVMQLAQQEGRAATSPNVFQQMGLRISRRPSTSDPENQRVKLVAERARSGLLTGTHSASPSRPSSRGPSRESSSLHWVPPRQGPGLELGSGLEPSGDGVSPLRQGIPRHSMAATVSVSSLLDALKDDSQQRQAETFEEQHLGHRPSAVPTKFKQLISDCLSPTSSLRAHKHHRLAEGDEVDTPPPRPVTPPGGPADAQVQEGLQQTASGHKRMRLSPTEAAEVDSLALQQPAALDTPRPLQRLGSNVPASPFADAHTSGSSNLLDGFSTQPQVSDAASMAQQDIGGKAETPFSGSSSDAMTQVGTPAGRPLQTPFASSSQPGFSDVSAGTDASTSSHRPSLQGMALQMSVELIPYEELRWGRFLGRGAEGAVYAAWYLETPVAVKRPESKVEVEMNLHSGSHDNIVALRGLCQNDEDLYLVMEYCPRGTLDVMLHHSAATQWDSAKLVNMVRSIARGMLHLHTRKPPMLHRDLKPGNIFVGHGLVMKIGDFGMSRQIIMARDSNDAVGLERALSSNVIGTAAYCAPELLLADSPVKRNRVSAATILKSDVYSFGVTLWQIMERKRPFEGMEPYQVQAQWILGTDVQLPPVTIPEDASETSRRVVQSLAQMVQDCTQFEAEKRPSFREIVDKLRTLMPGGAADTFATGNQPPVF